MSLENDFKNFFHLSKNEMRGTLALVLLILILLGIRISIPYYKAYEYSLVKDTLSANLIKQLDENRLQQLNATSIEKNNKGAGKYPVVLQEFDPNTANSNELLSLGFKEFQVKNILNYRNKGGKFFKKEDLLRLYTIKADDFSRIASYVKITSNVIPSELKREGEKTVKETSVKTIVELNSADTTALKSLVGVGSYFAQKIIDYRNKLGGFVSTEQLKEVWNLDPAILEKNAQVLKVDARKAKQLNINTLSVDELKKHPYISYRTAKAIVSYRSQHDNYTAIKEITNSVLISDSIYNKIAPYLKIND